MYLTVHASMQPRLLAFILRTRTDTCILGCANIHSLSPFIHALIHTCFHINVCMYISFEGLFASHISLHRAKLHLSERACMPFLVSIAHYVDPPPSTARALQREYRCWPGRAHPNTGGDSSAADPSLSLGAIQIRNRASAY